MASSCSAAAAEAEGFFGAGRSLACCTNNLILLEILIVLQREHGLELTDSSVIDTGETNVADVGRNAIVMIVLFALSKDLIRCDHPFGCICSEDNFFAYSRVERAEADAADAKSICAFESICHGLTNVLCYHSVILATFLHINMDDKACWNDGTLRDILTEDAVGFQKVVIELRA
jgi:hypothetical protein